MSPPSIRPVVPLIQSRHPSKRHQRRLHHLDATVPVILLFPLVLAGFTACRPDVELAIPCGINGDLSCPTGYHCGLHQACEPSEAPPTIVPEESLDHDELYGTIRFSARLTSPLGIHSAQVQLRSFADATAIHLPASVEYDDDTRTTAVLGVDVETWRLPDGAAGLIVTAYAEGEIPPARLEMPFTIANGLPSFALAKGTLAPPLIAPRSVTIQVTSRVGLKRIAASLGEWELHPGVYWNDGGRHAAIVELQLDPSEYPPGEYPFILTATDHAHRTDEFRALISIPSRE